MNAPRFFSELVYLVYNFFGHKYILLWLCLLPILIIGFEVKGQDLKHHDTFSSHSEWCDYAEDNRFGESVVSGDINNDGLDDLVVLGKRSEEITVYFGFVTGWFSYGNKIIDIPFGSTITMEDVNGDNYSDLVVADYGDIIYYYGGPDKQAFGESKHTINLSESTLTEVASSGDFDNDGVNDVIAYFPTTENSYVVYGFSSVLGISERTPQMVEHIDFIRAKGNIGDINNDGHFDVITRLERNFNEPQVVVILLGPDHNSNNPAWQVTGSSSESSYMFGYSCGSAGDINGDGFTDIFIGDARYNTTPDDMTHLGFWGKIYVWYGGPASAGNLTGFGNATTSGADFTIPGSYISGSFGHSITAGEFNGDGYGDLVIGDPRGADYCFDPETSEQLIEETGLVSTYLSTLAPPDNDDDGVSDTDDNCPNISNPSQANQDGDSHGDACDNCTYTTNYEQEDSDNDGMGDACDICTRDHLDDVDNDGYCVGVGYTSPKIGDEDNCPETFNPNQLDTDNDGRGDLCDNCIQVMNFDQKDRDADHVGDTCDNCPNIENTNQNDSDNDFVGDICDNCVSVSNSRRYWTDINGFYHRYEQQDTDLDGLGDACDNCPRTPSLDQTDNDNDGVGNLCDNCPNSSNTSQQDSDGDGLGDICDICPNDSDNDVDGDGVCGDIDNCPDHFNDTQADKNNDGIGDACATDLSISNFELTQAIQNSNNRLPLIKGKQSWLRVYLNIGDGPDSIQNVTGKVTGFRNDGSKQDLFPHPRYITAHKNPDKANINHSLNYRIPQNWRSDHGSNYTFGIFLNHDRSVHELDYFNNSLGAGSRPILETHTLTLKIIPITVNGCTPTMGDILRGVNHIQKVYPVSRINVEIQSGFTYSKDPSVKPNNSELLSKIRKCFLERLFLYEGDFVKYQGVVCNINDYGGTGGVGGTGGCAYLSDHASWAQISRAPHHGSAMAHEIGHNYRLEHTPDVSDYRGGYNFPRYKDESGNLYNESSIGLYGYDADTIYDPHDTYDFMSYKNTSSCWVSPFHYKRLANKFFPNWDDIYSVTTTDIQETSAPEETRPPVVKDNTTLLSYMVISGYLIEPDSILLDPARTIEISELPDRDDQQLAYTVELQDNNNNTLEKVNPKIIQSSGVSSWDYLLAFAPFHEDIAKIIVFYNGQAISTILVSENTPNIQLISPNGGETITDYCNISWIAADEDNGTLLYDVYFSSNGGDEWMPVALDLDTTYYRFDCMKVTGSDSALIKVIANDGAKSGYDISDSFFKVTDKQPFMIIISPQEGEEFFKDQPIIFEGHGYDFEDGLLHEETLQWNSSIDGHMGSGSQIMFDSLSPGTHIIDAIATDSDMNQTVESLSIKIINDTDYDADRVADKTDNCPTTHNPKQEDSDSDGIGNMCDTDDKDKDGYFDYADNCPDLPNDQTDMDLDGIGDDCDNCIASIIEDTLNVLKNGAFDKCELSPWYLWTVQDRGIEAEIQLNQGACTVSEIDAPTSASPYEIQIIQELQPDQIAMLKVNKTYLLSFEASSTKNQRPCHVYFGLNNNPWTDFLDQNIEISSKSKEYKLEFRYVNELPSIKLAFELGSDTSSVTFDNVRLWHKITDTDGDLIEDSHDNCPSVANHSQSDADHDNIGDICDNCPFDANSSQTDSDNNGIGDICEEQGTKINIQNKTNGSELRVFPNPSEDIINIELIAPNENLNRLLIIDITGRIVRQYSTIKGNKLIIEKGNLKPGIYFLKIITTDEDYLVKVNFNG